MRFKEIVKFGAFAAATILAVIFTGCTMKYTFSGASIHADAKTFSVAYFPNNAAMVAPILSSTLTEALKDKMSRQTRLSEVREGGDLSFEGEIVGYTSTSAAVSADEDLRTVKNKLTITIKVRFTNSIEPQYNFDKTFSSYLEYDANSNLVELEGQLIPDIVEVLVDDVFNAAVSNW